MNIDKKTNKSEYLIQELSQQINLGSFAVDTPFYSTRKLAEIYSISTLTANRIINRLVESKLLYRIDKKGTFVGAHRPWKAKHLQIGIDLYMGYNNTEERNYGWFNHYNQTLCSKLKERGFELKLFTDIDNNNIRVLEYSLANVDALLLTNRLLNNKNIELIKDFAGPVILLNWPGPTVEPFNQIIPDFFDGFSNIAKYFLKNDIKDLMVASFSNTMAHIIRRNTFVEVIRKYYPQISLVQNLQYEHEFGDYGQDCGRKIAQDYLAMSERPRGIYATSDYIALGIIEELAKHNLKDREDFFLVGTDNIEPYIYPEREPILTTLEQPRNKLINGVVDLVDELLNSSQKSIKIVKYPMNKLIIRK